MSDVLIATGLHKAFREGETELMVLNELDLTVKEGERVAVLGRSGSGKSTLLHVLAGLTRPDAGDVLVNGESIVHASAQQQASMRNRYMGFVYQFHHLLADFTACENVAMPLLIGGTAYKDALRTSEALLEQVDLLDRRTHKPHQLSGGERQRVAVARAVVGQPRVVLADEPSGNLDSGNAMTIRSLIRQLSEQFGTAFVLVTHDPNMAEAMDRRLRLSGGRLQSQD